jgi:hypothetical protein
LSEVIEELMSKWRGEPVNGYAFYALLCADDRFCAELGRAVLAAGRLETALKQYVIDNADENDLSRATLGQLINTARKHKLLLKMLPVLEMVKDQRNYLTHSVHALHSGFVEETILEGSNLLDSDVHTYMERASELAGNLNGLAEILERQSASPEEGS